MALIKEVMGGSDEKDLGGTNEKGSGWHCHCDW